MIAVMDYMHAVRQPADGKRGRNAPEEAAVECIADRVRVVVNGVCPGVVVIHRPRLVHDDALRFIVRHVDNVVLDRRDLDAAVATCHRLVRVTLQVTGCVRTIAKTFYRADHVGLLGDHGFTQAPGPVQVLIEQFNYLRIIEQRDDRVIPVFIRFQRRVSLQVFEEPLRLHELQRIRGCWQHDREEIVGIQGYRADQLLQFGARQERNVLVSGACIRFERFVVRKGGSAVIDRNLRGRRRHRDRGE